MLDRLGFAVWRTVAALPVVAVMISSAVGHPEFVFMVFWFVFGFAGISIFGIFVMATSLLKRSNRFTFAVSAGAASAYVLYWWSFGIGFS